MLQTATPAAATSPDSAGPLNDHLPPTRGSAHVLVRRVVVLRTPLRHRSLVDLRHGAVRRHVFLVLAAVPGLPARPVDNPDVRARRARWRQRAGLALAG